MVRFGNAVYRLASSSMQMLRAPRLLSAAGVVIALALAVLIRIPLLDFKSVDYFNERIQMYPLIQQQGVAALANPASNYNPPYFYALYVIARFLPGLPMEVAVKLPAIIADFLCAFFVFLIVKLEYPQGRTALYAGLSILFIPTVVANAAFWGQVDSIHTAGLLLCIYFLLKPQPFWALLAFGVALAIKLQAVFLAPLLLALLLRRELSWKLFLLVPAVLFLALVPAWMAGRPLLDLLTIYFRQASQFETMTMNAASLYAWFPNTKQVFDLLYLPGLIVGAAAAFLLTTVIYKAPGRLSPALLLELALLSALVVPFFLPKMHERYFFPADVISIAFAAYFPQFFYVPLAVIGVSSLSYLPFLFGIEPVPLPILALVLLVVITLLAYHSVRQLYAPADRSMTAEAPPLDQPRSPDVSSAMGEPA